MRTLLCAVMALGLVVVGCGNNDCEDAVEKLDECGVDLGEGKPTDDEASECNADDECGAKCINDGSCADIKATFTGTSTTNSFATCISACSK